jgi:protein-disulfide isomerase
MNYLRTSRKIAFGGLFATSILLSGCSIESITNDAESIIEGGKSEVIKTAASDISEIVSESRAVGAISDENFEKAFEKYLQENPIKFGKQVDAAYEIYREDLQKNANVERQKQLEKTSELVKGVRAFEEGEHIKGVKNISDAKFVLYEYSDYHCPYCTKFHATTKKFLEENDDVALVFRAYPAVHGQTSGPLHVAAECIAKEAGNDAFWVFTDEAFKNKSLRVKDLESTISDLKISNSAKIIKCVKDGKFRALVGKSSQEANSLGINGTPGSILKNVETGEVRFINGAYPLSELTKFKKELSEVK